MYKQMLQRNGRSVKDLTKLFFTYSRRRRGAALVWRAGFRKRLKLHPEFKHPADPKLEEAHKAYWAPFRRKVNLDTLRISYHISGKANPKCIPEEIWEADYEPTLNPTSSIEYLTYKSFYNHWHQHHLFPRDYLHNIDGAWLDQDLNCMTQVEFEHIADALPYPVVMKPNRDSYGGRNILFPGSRDQLMDMVAGKKNFVIQEKLVQHPILQKYNHHGINSFRVNIYRSVKDNQLHIINVAFKMGVGGSLDNLTAGGISVLIRKDGVMDGFAQDNYGKKFLKHPDTGLLFNQEIPDFEQMKRVALEVAERVFYARVICLDMCYDAEGRWRMIEVNLNGTTLRFAQNHGIPFFDEYSDEVRQYCIDHHWAFGRIGDNQKKISQSAAYVSKDYIK